MICFRNSALSLTLPCALLTLSALSGCGKEDSSPLPTKEKKEDGLVMERDFGTKIRVLVSTYEPVDGRPQNNSEFVGDLLPEYVKNFEIVPCPSMPVEYDAAPARLIKCFEQHPNVSAVISLGEANDDIEVERYAMNLDDTEHSDNSGVIRSDVVIVEGAPTYYELPLSPVTLPRFSLPSNSPVRVRYDSMPGGMGNFVCNHTAFRFMHYLKSRNLNVPYGFIHVPHAMDPEAGHNPYEIARAIGNFFEKSLRAKLRPLTES